MATIWQNLKSNLSTYIITTIITLITVFSNKIIENIKFALNRADLRVSSYESLASSISDFVFSSEDLTECYVNGWTSLKSLQAIVPNYNESIINLRKKEYVMINYLSRFWGKSDVDDFKSIMATVKKIDFQIHSLNTEAEQILNGKKEKADTSITKPITNKLIILNSELENKIGGFLTKLI